MLLVTTVGAMDGSQLNLTVEVPKQVAEVSCLRFGSPGPGQAGQLKRLLRGLVGSGKVLRRKGWVGLALGRHIPAGALLR